LTIAQRRELVQPKDLTVGIYASREVFRFANPQTVSATDSSRLSNIASVGQNMVMFVGPPVVGAMAAGGNWAGGVPPRVVALAVGRDAALLIPAMQRVG
jgi:hypothetical protein